PISLREIEQRYGDKIETREDITFDPVSASLRGRRSERFGALALTERQIQVVASDENARRLAAGLVRAGVDRLPWSKPLRQWRDRAMFLRRHLGGDWPDLSDGALAERADEWLAPMLHGK